MNIFQGQGQGQGQDLQEVSSRIPKAKARPRAQQDWRLVLISPKVDIHSTVPQGRRMGVNLGNAVRVCSLGTKLYSANQRVAPHKTFCNIFTRAWHISVKFC